jgi:hypothetical protein
MTGFQKLALIAFAAVVLSTYGKDIYAWLKARLAAVKLPVTPTAPVSPDNTPGDVMLVDELLDIAALRQYFEQAKCAEGVAACSNLLKILIDHTHPHAG